MNNLILGVINYYNFHQVSNFIYTLKKTDFNGRVCLFAGSFVNKKTTFLLKHLGVEIIDFKENFPFIPTPHTDNFKGLPDPIHIYNYRHYLYYDYLLKYGEHYDNVLITDVKDVVFQKDPFDFDMEDKICVAMENIKVPIGDCECNTKWILSGYGNDVLQLLKDKAPICAGTTLAPTFLMKNYLKRLLEEMIEVNDAYHCADQALHNVLIYFNKIEPIKYLYNFDGPILTAGTELNYKLNKKQKLINDNGDVINIIHQYDRHPELLSLFNKIADPLSLKKYFVKAYYKFL